MQTEILYQAQTTSRNTYCWQVETYSIYTRGLIYEWKITYSLHGKHRRPLTISVTFFLEKRIINFCLTCKRVLENEMTVLTVVEFHMQRYLVEWLRSVVHSSKEQMDFRTSFTAGAARTTTCVIGKCRHRQLTQSTVVLILHGCVLCIVVQQWQKWTPRPGGTLGCIKSGAPDC